MIVDDFLRDKIVVVFGGTGSLGQVLCRRLLGLAIQRLVVVSRDEAKQYALQRETDIGGDPRLQLVLGDIRDPVTVAQAVHGTDVVVNAAALKQVPACEYAPWEAVRTNVQGAENLVAAIAASTRPPSVVIGISTDKACKPVNTMGMTKALQERIMIQANLRATGTTRFLCVRYGNVLASRGSVIPLFQRQIAAGGPVTLTSGSMTRFLLSLDLAVDTVLTAVLHGRAGEIWVPDCQSARVHDIARMLIGNSRTSLLETGVRPGEKIHEILISEEEARRCRHLLPGWHTIRPALPELCDGFADSEAEHGEFSSSEALMSPEDLLHLLRGSRPSPEAVTGPHPPGELRL